MGLLIPLILLPCPCSLCQATRQAVKEVISRRKWKPPPAYTSLLLVPSSHMAGIRPSPSPFSLPASAIPGSLGLTGLRTARAVCSSPQLFRVFLLWCSQALSQQLPQAVFLKQFCLIPAVLHPGVPATGHTQAGKDSPLPCTLSPVILPTAPFLTCFSGPLSLCI